MSKEKAQQIVDLISDIARHNALQVYHERTVLQENANRDRRVVNERKQQLVTLLTEEK